MAQNKFSTTNLTANETRTIGAISTTNDDHVVGIVRTSHAGTLFIEQSINGNDWDFGTTVAVAADTGVSFKQELFAPFVRLRYANGATATTFFRFRARTTAIGHR